MTSAHEPEVQQPHSSQRCGYGKIKGEKISHKIGGGTLDLAF